MKKFLLGITMALMLLLASCESGSSTTETVEPEINYNEVYIHGIITDVYSNERIEGAKITWQDYIDGEGTMQDASTNSNGYYSISTLCQDTEHEIMFSADGYATVTHHFTNTSADQDADIQLDFSMYKSASTLKGRVWLKQDENTIVTKAGIAIFAEASNPLNLTQASFTPKVFKAYTDSNGIYEIKNIPGDGIVYSITMNQFQEGNYIYANGVILTGRGIQHEETFVMSDIVIQGTDIEAPIIVGTNFNDGQYADGQLFEDEDFEFEFSREMDRGSFLIRVISDTDNNAEIPFTYAWNNESTKLVIDPNADLVPTHTYHVSLGDMACATNGKLLAYPTYGISNLKVTVYGRNVETNLNAEMDAYDELEVVFNAPMNEITFDISIRDQQNNEAPLTYEWDETALTLTIYPTYGLSYGRSYILDLGSTRYATGETLDINEFDFSIRDNSDGLNNNYESISFLNQLIGPDNNLTITFPVEMNTETFVIGITDTDGVIIPSSATWYDSNKTLVINPTYSFAYGREYSLSLGNNIEFANGGLLSSQEQIFDIMIIDNVYGIDNNYDSISFLDQVISPDSDLTVVFSVEMDIETFEIEISDMSGVVIPSSSSWDVAGKTLTVSPTYGLAYGREYILKLGSSIEFANGGLLSNQPQNFSIVIEDYLAGLNNDVSSTNFFEVEIQPDSKLTINFTRQMDTPSFLINLFDSLSDPVAITYVWRNSNTTLEITPTTSLVNGSTYTLSLGDQVKNINGESVIIEANLLAVTVVP
jgi:hypothetical protein